MKRTRSLRNGADAMPPAPLKLPGTHRVKKSLAGGRVAFYWYRTRGGDLLMKFAGDTLGSALTAEREGATALALAYGTSSAKPEAAKATVRGLIVRYRSAPNGFVPLASKTKVNWRRSLDIIEAKFGDLPLKALGAKGVKSAMIAWRDSFSDTPRQADIHMTVLKRLLSWAVKNEEIDINPVKGVEGLYRSNRADLIIEPGELVAILENATTDACRAIRFAAATGLRREDVCKVQWQHVHGNHIKFATGKSRGRKTVVVPLFGDASAIVEEARKQRDQVLANGEVPSAFVLLTGRKTSWKPDSLTQAFIRAADAAGVKGRTLNDLRGTAITRFAAAGLTNEQIADIVGWELTKVSNIRKHYVDSANVARALIEQLERAEKTG